MKTKAKKIAVNRRDRRKMRTRQTVRGTESRPRVSVFRSGKHIYAQIISDETHATLVSASTLDKDVQAELKGIAEGGKGSTKSVSAAKAVGIVLARRGKSKKVSEVVFDRNGFLYTGRIKALADGAREGGLKF